MSIWVCCGVKDTGICFKALRDLTRHRPNLALEPGPDPSSSDLAVNDFEIASLHPFNCCRRGAIPAKMSELELKIVLTVGVACLIVMVYALTQGELLSAGGLALNGIALMWAYRMEKRRRLEDSGSSSAAVSE